MSVPGKRLAAAFAGVTVSLVVAGLTILVLTLDHPPLGGWGFRGFTILFAIPFGILGWLIMTRRPGNRIGLLFGYSAVLAAGQLFLTEYASAGLRTSLPASNLAALINAWIWVPALAMMAGAMPLIFPDGRLPSRRWRPAAWLLIGSTVALIAIITAFPSAIDTPRIVRRDFRIPIDDATLNSLSYVALSGLGISVVAAGASVFVRWRSATGVVREQLKWLAYSVGLVIATMWLSIVPNPLASAAFILAIASMPVAVGIAVLRYRLYEIDAVISRTLVFGALTAILTGGFAALQKGLQEVFVAVTGNESDAATIITTLVLATAFVPLKKGLEGLVQRRLDRGKLPTRDAVETPAVGAVHGDPGLEELLRRVVREELDRAMTAIAAAPTVGQPTPDRAPAPDRR